MILTWRDGEICDSFDTQSIPHCRKIFAFVELDLICYRASAELFVMSVLEVPPRRRLLYKAPNHIVFPLTFVAFPIPYAPDFEVFDGIAIVIL